VEYLLSPKLDAYSKREYEKKVLQLGTSEKPKVKEIIEFLNAHYKYLEHNNINKQNDMNKDMPASTKTLKFRTNKLSATFHKKRV